MDQSYQLYFFILSTTTLFTDIKSTDNFLHNWFDAQNHCLGQGLTIERNKSDQPHWTGVYRRLTPWVNILGCYSYSIESLEDVVKKTMTISSVGMCQEICRHENIDQFAVKMNDCLCIERNNHSGPFSRLPASDCNFKCEDDADDIYLGDCGGESAYNIYETQRVHFNSLKTCLSLQCSPGDTRLIPQKCSNIFDKVCENITLPDNGFASNWSISMEQCKQSQPSTYLLGDIDLNYLHMVCERIPRHLQIVWLGVARQIDKSIDHGWEINEEQRETFLECQMCEMNACQFRSCSNLLASSIFCKNISDRFQGKKTSTLMSNHSTSDVMFASRSTTGNYDQDQLPSTNESGTSDNLVLKISLPLIVSFITLFSCVVGVVLYKRNMNILWNSHQEYCLERFCKKNIRRGKMTKTDRTTKAEVKSVLEKQVYSELFFSESNSSFALEHCYQKISKGSNLSNESPYYNSEEGVDGHLKDIQGRETEGNTIYQNPSTDMTGDMSGYDTIANANNKNQEKEATYDQLQQDTNETY